MLQRLVLLGWLVVQSGNANVAMARWISNGPPGTVNAIAIDPQTPTTLYAGTLGGGVFKSSNGGGSWTAINTGLTNLALRALAIDPQTPATVYAGTDGGNVFKSTNGGGNWTSIPTGAFGVYALAIDPQTP